MDGESVSEATGYRLRARVGAEAPTSESSEGDPSGSPARVGAEAPTSGRRTARGRLAAHLLIDAEADEGAAAGWHLDLEAAADEFGALPHRDHAQAGTAGAVGPKPGAVVLDLE